jgi:hypothetical protein
VVEYAEQQIGLRAVTAGQHRVGIQRDRLLELAHGFVEAMQVAQRHAKVDIAVGKVRLELDRTLIATDLLVEPAQVSKGLALVVKHLEGTRLELHGRIERRQRRLGLALGRL